MHGFLSAVFFFVGADIGTKWDDVKKQWIKQSNSPDFDWLSWLNWAGVYRSSISFRRIGLL